MIINYTEKKIGWEGSIPLIEGMKTTFDWINEQVKLQKIMAKNKTVVILDQTSGYLQIDMLDALSKNMISVIIAGTIVERETKLSENTSGIKLRNTINLRHSKEFTLG